MNFVGHKVKLEFYLFWCRQGLSAPLPQQGTQRLPWIKTDPGQKKKSRRENAILFGQKKGSFTGATEVRKGLLAEDGGGTVFLDEIGELDLKAQAILLRVMIICFKYRSSSKPSADLPCECAWNRGQASDANTRRF